ncbi:phosphotransferase [Spirillospora sp. NPDC029432]|uniref:phosphotransferase n=1 Tax=Spirillospora sp. NPDC029432 TaxID=3154599 RepID=UPI003452876F
MARQAWCEILAKHYRHKSVKLLRSMRRYSLHFLYRHDGDRAGGDRYVLSQVRRERSRVPFRLQFEIIDRLSRGDGTIMVRRMLPCAEPCTDPARRWVDDGTHYWFVRSYTEHDPEPDWHDPRLVSASARQLARIHEAAMGFPGRLGELRRDIAPYHWPVRRVLDDRAAFVDGMSGNRSEEDILAVKRNLAELDEQAAAGLRLGPTGITHQDYRPGNILVRDGEIVDVIDWDLARKDHFLYDAVLAAFHVGWCRTGNGRLDAAERFIDAYLNAIDIGIDKAAVGWMFRYVTTRNLVVSHSPEKWRELLRDVERRGQGHWPY